MRTEQLNVALRQAFNPLDFAAFPANQHRKSVGVIDKDFHHMYLVLCAFGHRRRATRRLFV
jgi:hypothetical protein